MELLVWPKAIYVKYKKISKRDIDDKEDFKIAQILYEKYF